MWAISSVVRSYSQFKTRAMVRYLNVICLLKAKEDPFCLTLILSRRGTCPLRAACRWPPPHSTCQRPDPPPCSSSPRAPCILTSEHLLIVKLILVSRNLQSFTWCTDHVLDLNSVCTIQVSCETKINQFEAEIRVLTIIASVINTRKSLYIFNTLFENTILKGLMSRWMIFFEWR